MCSWEKQEIAAAPKMKRISSAKVHLAKKNQILFADPKRRQRFFLPPSVRREVKGLSELLLLCLFQQGLGEMKITVLLLAGVVAYPAKVYGGLTVEVITEVGEKVPDMCSTTCVCIRTF